LDKEKLMKRPHVSLKLILIVAAMLARSQHRKSSIQFVFVDLSDCDISEFSNIR
jgi:hypothetical protein